MNKCLKCGSSYRGDRCPMCGYSPSPVYSDPSQEPFITMYGAPIPYKRKRSLVKWIIFVVCVILGSVLLLGLNFKPNPCLYGPRPVDDSLQWKELTNPVISEKE